MVEASSDNTKEVLIFNACGPKSSPWTDPDFDVTEKGDNNFQDTGRFPIASKAIYRGFILL